MKPTPDSTVRMSVVSRVRIPGVGSYYRVRAAHDKEYWVSDRSRYTNGTYYEPLSSITVPEGSVVEVPAVRREVDVIAPDL